MRSALFAMRVTGIPAVHSFVLAVADTRRFHCTHDVNCSEQLQAVSDKEECSHIISYER